MMAKDPTPKDDEAKKPVQRRPIRRTRSAGATPDMPEYRKVEGDYGADQLEHLSDLEHVRERPSMYIGDTGLRGLHHLVYEVVDNSIDEAMAGFAQTCSRDDQYRRLGHGRR